MSNIGNNNYQKILPTFLLIIFLPVLFVLYLNSLLVNIDKNQEFEAIKSKLSERATDFMVKTTPIDYYKPIFQKLSYQLLACVEANNKDFQTDISKKIEEFNNKFGVNFRCALFDRDLNLINPQNLKDYEQRFFTYTWKESHSEVSAEYPDRKVDQTLFLGMEFNPKVLKNHSEFCMTSFSLGKKGLLYLKNSSNKNSGIIIFVEYSKTSLELLEDKIKEYSTKEQPIILYNKESKSITSNTFEHKVIPYDWTNSEAFLDGFVDKDMFWRGFNSDEYKLLFGLKLEQPNKYKIRLIVSSVIILFVLVLLSVFFFKNTSSKEGMFISIRYKLIFIFALAVYMPTLSIWVLSYTTLNYYRTALENTTKKGMLDVLNKIDNDYKHKEEKLRNCFIKLDNYLASFSGKKAPTSKEVERKLQEIVGENAEIKEVFNWLDIWNINQTQIYTTSSDDSNSRIEDISRVIELLCLDRYCPERLSHAGIKLSQSDILVGNLFENPVSGFAYIFERPEKIVFQNINEIGTYWWWNYYSDKENPIAFCFGNSDIRHNTVSYFKSLSKTRYTFENTNLRLVNMHYATQVFVPEQAGDCKDLTELVNLSNVNKTVESSIVNYENTKYLCLCVPGSCLIDCYSLCMYPVSEIDYKIDKVRSSIYTVMILLLIISIFTGLLLAKNFITPVKELNKGLVALRNRNTDTKIKIDNKDELGLLGNAFNQMMVEIKDLLLAGEVQRCLIPSGKYKIEDYDCVIFNQMAADVGGDYADIFGLPEDKFLIVIGDVTGHGVSSSILTAMVKASVFCLADQNIPLNEIVNSTSNMIYDLLSKKKFMTFCAIILDRNTGEMIICNAGHPNPIIRSSKIGDYRTIGKPSFPMGFNKKRCRYTTESDWLKAGETLFLYTDGFPEAENEKGEMYGYDTFNQLIANCNISTSEEMKNYLLDVFNKHHGEAELADDITFVILRRKPLQDC